MSYQKPFPKSLKNNPGKLTRVVHLLFLSQALGTLTASIRTIHPTATSQLRRRWQLHVPHTAQHLTRRRRSLLGESHSHSCLRLSLQQPEKKTVASAIWLRILIPPVCAHFATNRETPILNSHLVECFLPTSVGFAKRILQCIRVKLRPCRIIFRSDGSTFQSSRAA